MLARMARTFTASNVNDCIASEPYASLDSEEQKKHFTDDPAAYLQYRKAVDEEFNDRFKFV
jgi:hypothetical protein